MGRFVSGMRRITSSGRSSLSEKHTVMIVTLFIFICDLSRTLQLNAVPECLAYSGFGGTLFLGIRGDLYIMNCEKFLPRTCRQTVTRQLAVWLMDVCDISLIPIYFHSSFTLTVLSLFPTCLSPRIQNSAASESKIYLHHILIIIVQNNDLIS